MIRSWAVSLSLFGLGIIALVGTLVNWSELGWGRAHGVVMFVATTLAIESLHLATIRRFRPGTLNERHAQQLAIVMLAGAILLFLGHLLQPSNVFAVVALIGWLVILAGSIKAFLIIRKCAPARGSSVVDMEQNPLTKGDDASWKHVRMAHLFLPIGVLLASATYWPGASVLEWTIRLQGAGIHVLGIGFGLLSLYGLGHIWVPRFSGVPAIAAGAIKGELHSTLPAMILIPIGFALDMRGLIIAGGAFAFLGFFTYMGVLGANIMRNKSVTHRVTPDFVYIPWTFSGIFWLISGVLLGIFLNVVPELLAEVQEGMSSVHVHILLFGGVGQLLLGWATRIAPRSQNPPQFRGPMSLSFYLFNIAVGVAIWFQLGGSTSTGWVALNLLIASLVLYGWAMQAFFRAGRSEQAE